MSFTLQSSRSARGLTLVEVLVAVTIVSVFMGSVTLAFLQVSRAADYAQALTQAHTRARSALGVIGRDLADIRYDASIPDPAQVFTLLDGIGEGDRLDQDGDGAVDEEIVDGRDDDCDWTIGDDRHALLPGGAVERPQYQGLPDLGDASIDEDIRFGNDRLLFRIPSSPLLGGSPFPREIEYYIDSFGGRDFVLLRRERNASLLSTPFDAPEPIASDVVGFDVLAWNDNGSFPDNGTCLGTDYSEYWKTTFSVGQVLADDPMTTDLLPTSIYVRVTVNAERLPLRELTWPAVANAPLRTVSLATVITPDLSVASGLPRRRTNTLISSAGGANP